MMAVSARLGKVALRHKTARKASLFIPRLP
jgi:hypothetical protein